MKNKIIIAIVVLGFLAVIFGHVDVKKPIPAENNSPETYAKSATYATSSVQ